MFTGLIQHLVPVVEVVGNDEGLEITVEKPAIEKLELGESISIDGACLTVTAFDEKQIHFFVGQETLLKTTLGSLQPGQRVNFERSLALGDRLGGHMVSGHVDQTGVVKATEMRGLCLWLKVGVLPEQFKLMVPKGSVALNGVSLTVNEVSRDDKTFEVLLIPETLARTNLADCRAGNKVNIECDQMVKIIANHLSHFAAEGRALFGSLA